MNYYTCEICDELNSSARFTCRCCGTIPARYSVLRTPATFKHDDFVSVVRAIGCFQAFPAHAKIGLRTVRADYYAFD